jgi:magnesium chelatase accessory protein
MRAGATDGGAGRASAGDVAAEIPPDWPNRDASRLVRCRPHRWHLQVRGSGPDVLFLHGAGASAHSFAALSGLVSAAGWRTVAPDLPGHGFTRLGVRGRSGLDAMAEDLAALLAQEGIRPAAIIGHSAGAAIALRLAEMLPAAPRCIVGINAALGPFEGVAGWLFPVIARVLALNPLVPQLFSRGSRAPAQIARLIGSTGSALDAHGLDLYRRLVADPRHVEGALAMMAQWRLEGILSRLAGIALPCLLVTADRDRAVPPATSARAAAAMPAAELVSLTGFGHLVHEEAPGAVASLILPFLERHASPRP